VHICFELVDAFRGESVRDGFTLSGVLCTIAGVEETALNGDECVIVVPSKMRGDTAVAEGLSTHDFKNPFPWP
jgi:hypothetical protein